MNQPQQRQQMPVQQQQKQLPAQQSQQQQVAKATELVAWMTPELKQFCEFAVQSQFFAESGIKNVGSAIMKVAYGVKIGLDPIEALNEVYVVRGKFAMEPNAIATHFANHPRYDLQIVEREIRSAKGEVSRKVELDDDHCTVQVYLDGKPKGNEVTFTWQEACEMGLASKSTWKSNRQNQLFYKAAARAQRLWARDLFKIPIYDREELEASEVMVHIDTSTASPADVAIANAGRKRRGSRAVASDAQTGLSQASEQQTVTDVEALPGDTTQAESAAPAESTPPSETSAFDPNAVVTINDVRAGLQDKDVVAKGWDTLKLTQFAQKLLKKPLPKLTFAELETVLDHARQNNPE